MREACRRWPSPARAGSRSRPTSTGRRRAGRRSHRPSGSRARPPRSSCLAPPSSPAGAPSSAGWKMNFTVPGRCARSPASTSATPIRIATWASWPQACMTPTSWPLYVDAHRGRERDVDLLGHRQRVHVGAQRDHRPGLPPRRTPTTPVCGDAGAAPRARASRRWSATSFGGAELAVDELGVLVDVAPPGDDLRLEVPGPAGPPRPRGASGPWARSAGDRSGPAG